jgi:transcriptional regulator with XRE-family HTH domain
MLLGMSAKYPELGARIKAAMLERGYKSAAALADAMQVEGSRVRNWANGHGRPTVDQGIVIKRVLGVTLDWLYEGDPDGVPYALYIRLAARITGEAAPTMLDDEPAEAPAEVSASVAASKSVDRPSKAKRASANSRS